MCLDFLVDMKLKPAPEHFFWVNCKILGSYEALRRVRTSQSKCRQAAAFLWCDLKTGLHSWKYMGMGHLSYQIWGHEHPFTSHFDVNRRVPGFWLIPRSVYDRTSFSQPLPKGDPNNKQIDQAESLVFRGRVYDTSGNGQKDQGDDFSSWIFSFKIAIQFHIFHPGDPGTGWS